MNLDSDGVNHLVDRHLDPTVNASQFTISQSDVLDLLKDPKTVSTPIIREVQSSQGVRYVREVDVGSPIGTDRFNNGQPTSVMTVMTDKYGNLVTAFPGKLK
ncbi:adhesin [Paraburkholderia azotifigens]|uniref:Adhesin n=1 Tax=Paraburkholderia azotifigens TaxID=2057004 RepID=A0A5C6VNX5_9BURK|nr:adhesin [Paraburkholderia azotifigens]